MLLHSGVMAPLGRPSDTAFDSACALRDTGSDHRSDPENEEDRSAVYALCDSGVSAPAPPRGLKGRFTVEAALLLSIILLVLAFIMRLGLKNREIILTQAAQYEAELAAEQDRFVPRDLIRLCQFIEVWFPQNGQ